MLNLKMIAELAKNEQKARARLLPLLDSMFHEVMYMPGATSSSSYGLFYNKPYDFNQKPYFSEDIFL